MKIANEILKSTNEKVLNTMRGKSVDQIAKSIAAETKYNDHAGAIIKLAQALDDEKFIDRAKQLDAEQSRKGELTRDLEGQRKALYAEMRKAGEKKFGKSEYKKIHMAF